MKINKIRLLKLFALICFVFAVPASAEVVYDSLSTTPRGFIMIMDIGNTITLSGNKRFITSFTFNVQVSSSNIGQTNDYVLRFYAPSGPNDSPGKLLWQSRPKTNVLMTGELQSVTIDVPYVRVPNTFIYSVMQAGDGSIVLCSGPTVGSSPAYCWTNLTKEVFTGSNQLQVRIEAQNRPDAVLLGKIRDNGNSSIGTDDFYMMNFMMLLGEYWDMFGPSFYGITGWDEGSYLHIDAEDLPEAVEYLTNGTDESLMIEMESLLHGNVESDTIVKSPGIAAGYPDLYGCVITDIGLKLDTISISHTTPGWTSFAWDVTWEIWGIQKSPDIDRNNKVDFSDFAVLASAWNSQQGQSNWNQLCDIRLPSDNLIDVADLAEFGADWLYGCGAGFDENFETGNFSSYGWQHSGNANWSVVSNAPYEGTYAAKSGTITHNGTSSLEVQVNVEGTNISFYRKVSSESGYDYLRFYIDGAEQNKWSGTVSWSQVSFPITPGPHTFKWSYTKDLSVSSGSDCTGSTRLK